MDHFERKFIYQILEGLSLSYLRFIGDINFIWQGSKTQLVTFLNGLNAKHSPIKFKYKMPQSSIPFLGKEVSIKNSKLNTKIYMKETDRQYFLHINSEHPTSLQNSIPYNQFLRVKRKCSTI